MFCLRAASTTATMAMISMRITVIAESMAINILSDDMGRLLNRPMMPVVQEKSDSDKQIPDIDQHLQHNE